MTGCTFQRPQEERRQAGAGVEKDREMPGQAREEAGSAPTGLLATRHLAVALTCHPTLYLRYERFKPRDRPDGLTPDLDHVLFSDSCFNIFETLARRRHWLRWEEGHRVDRGQGSGFQRQKAEPSAWVCKAGLCAFCCRRAAWRFAPGGAQLAGPFPEAMFRPLGKWLGGC